VEDDDDETGVNPAKARKLLDTLSDEEDEMGTSWMAHRVKFVKRCVGGVGVPVRVRRGC
jgi:hypothetical protein